MKKQNKQSSSTNAAIKVVEVGCESIASYYLMLVGMEATETITRGIAGFALVWFFTNVALFVYKFVISPAAKAIIASS